MISLCACQPADNNQNTSSVAADTPQSTSPAEPASDTSEREWAYPETAKIDQSDDYHGTTVEDPYRWLEDDVRESSEVADWVAAQNEVTFAYLETIPEREKIKERLTSLWDYEKFGVPFREGGKIFYFRNDGLQNQSVLYSQDSFDAEPGLVSDPNTFSEDGTVALADVEISPDGRYAAMAIQDGGSDWRTVRILDIKTLEELDDKLKWVKFSSLAWAADSSGFYYSRFPATEEGEEFQSLNKNQKIYFHATGTAQGADKLVYERPDHPDWLLIPQISDDGRFLVIYSQTGSGGNQMAFLDLTLKDAEAIFVTENFENEFGFVGNVGDKLIFRTNLDAPRGRLVAVDSNNPARDNWQELVPETEAVLRGASMVGNSLIAVYLKDAYSQVQQFALDGTAIRKVELPGIGSVSGFGGKADANESFYSYSSFNSPPTIYRFATDSGESTVFKTVNVDFDPADYVVKQVFYNSKDGTRVPMFIAHRTGLQLNGDTPTLLYGYGGFNVAVTPRFSISRLAWMEMGGIFALANIRGGGEYGDDWHKAGTKLQKQNVFDDFIAAGEYLVAERYTRPEKLAVMGGSNGGLLVGAVVNQRPDLFAAGLPSVGVMDMLRFHQFTAGRFWTDDYGSANNPEEFKALLAYSPYHNLKDGTEYPAIMVTTADTDDRVVPGHSFKYAARLQEAQAGKAPVMIRIETRAGHGSGKPTDLIIGEVADEWAFLADNLELELPESYGASE
ncbi:MAG: prolyl oligopeptidase family serine peptidase [Gammaproteobacteria bacterium]|nr:prolyl oligopeptidase family serine peptidase [Gammaproteobacteria bacterium]